MTRVWKRVVAAAVVLGMALAAAACTTTYLETTRSMANQRSSQHVQGWREHANSQRILPALPGAVSREQAAK